jgi:hypothetical protein
VINSLDLRELELSWRQYTWANNLQTPTYEKLDRILVSTDWELKYPKVNVHALPRALSDHTPLLLDTGMSSQHNPQMFKFELAWLFKDGFYDTVTRYGNQKQGVQMLCKFGKTKYDHWESISEDGQNI